MANLHPIIQRQETGQYIQQDNLTQQLEALQRALQAKEAQVNRLEAKVQEQEQLLKSIFASRGGKALIRYWRFLDMLKALPTAIQKIAKLAYRFPSLLQRSDYRRGMQYIKLFGVIALFREVNKLLWSENAHFFDGDFEIIPVTKQSIINRKVGDISVGNAMISVVIPTKNAGDDFHHLLSTLENQKGLRNIEIIVVDSGSTDKTVEIGMEFGAKIIHIRPEQFSHSYARNLGVEQATGEYILFTVQDAIPPSDFWLRELFDVIEANKIVALSCGESPRKDTDLFYGVSVWQFDRFMHVDKHDRILQKPNKENYFTLRMNSNLSNVACLISTDIVKAYKFRGNFAEDTDLGLRLIQDGHKLAFLGSARIIHSHNRSAYYHLKRGYVDTRFQSETFPDFIRSNEEIELLFHDIVLTYNFVNSIVCNELQQISVPCSIRMLAQKVMKALKSAKNGSYPIAIDTIDNMYIDSNFKSFLNNINSHCNFFDVDQLLNEVNMFDEVRVHTMMILEYMDNNYELLNKDLLEEFKACLYKVCAHLFGTHLSNCFLQGDDFTRKRLKEINNELTREI